MMGLYIHHIATYKFSRNNFYKQLAKIQEFCILSFAVLHVHCDCFKNFEDLIFVDDDTCKNSKNYYP